MLEPWRHWQLKTLTWTTPKHPYLCFERKHCGRWKRLGTLRWPQCQSCGCLTNFDAMHQNKQKIDCRRGGRSFCCTGSELTPPPIFASMQNTHLDSSDLFPANVLDVLCTRDSELLVWPTSGTSSGMSQSSSFGNPRQSTHCNAFWQLRAKLIHYSTVGCHERLLLQEMRCLSPNRMTFLGKELTFKGSNKCASQVPMQIVYCFSGCQRIHSDSPALERDRVLN